MKLNKGEWSEVYVFLKLLAEGKLYAADKDLKKIEDIYYSVLEIINKDINRYFEHKNGRVSIKDESENIYKEYDVRDFAKHALNLLTSIIDNKGSSFEVADTTNFMSELGISKLKAKSQDKRDIILKVHDSVIGRDDILGFSIKSNLLIKYLKQTKFLKMKWMLKHLIVIITIE